MARTRVAPPCRGALGYDWRMVPPAATVEPDSLRSAPTRSRRLRIVWVVGVSVALWGGLALALVATPAGTVPAAVPVALATVGALVESGLFARAARRRVLRPRLRIGLGLIAVAIGLTALLNVHDLAVLVVGVGPMPRRIFDLADLTTYVIGLAGMLWMPTAPHDRTSWLQFALDTAIACGGLLLVLAVAVTVPGLEAAGPQRSTITIVAIELTLMVVAIDVQSARGVAEPSRRALAAWLVAQAATVTQLAILQYAHGTGAVAPATEAALSLVVQLPFLAAGWLYLTEPVSSDDRPAFELLRWLNPLPLLTVLVVAAAVVVAQSLDARALPPLALGLAALVVLLAVRLVWSLVDNARLAARERAALEARVETVGRLAGGVAHEFNNLMTTVLANTELARATAPPALDEVLVDVRTAAQEAAAITRKLLSYAGRQMTSRAPRELGAVLDEVVEQLGPTLPAGVTLTWRRPAAGPVVAIDRGQLAHLLSELVANAGEAMAGSGAVAVRLAEVVLERALVTPFLPVPAGRWAVVEVEDRGGGIAAAELPWIFDPFYSTRTMHRGAGLGLAAVRGIVATHGGGLAVESVVGRGTTVRVYLPVVPSPATGGAPAS